MTRSLKLLGMLLLAFALLQAKFTEASPEAQIDGIVRISGAGVQSGTGFIIRISAGQADIVTAAHVIAGRSPLEVLFPGALGNPVPAETVVMDVDLDVAVIRTREVPQDAIVLHFDLEHEMKLGEEAYLLSFPRRATSPQVYWGRLAERKALHRLFEVRGEETFSGSPLLVGDKVVAMAVSKEAVSDLHLVNAFPAKNIQQALEGWGLVRSASQEAAKLAAALKSNRYRISWKGGLAGAGGQERTGLTTVAAVHEDHVEISYKWYNGAIYIRGVLKGTLVGRRFSGKWEEQGNGNNAGIFESEFNAAFSQATGLWQRNRSDERYSWSLDRLE